MSRISDRADIYRDQARGIMAELTEASDRRGGFSVRESIAMAQVLATLSLGERVADLVDAIDTGNGITAPDPGDR